MIKDALAALPKSFVLCVMLQSNTIFHTDQVSGNGRLPDPIFNRD